MWVVLPLGLLLLARLNRTDYRPLLLVAACFAMALAPVLPLSIALATPESERLIYMASAFGSILLVWLLAASIRQPRVLIVFVLALAAIHVRALLRVNRNWQEASAITQSILTTFGETMRAHGRIGSAVYVLNVPDSVNGAYIFRRGFHEALRVTAPDQVGAMAQTYPLSVYSIFERSIPPRVTRLSPRTLEVHVEGGWLLGAPNPATEAMALHDWRPQSFVVAFTPVADGSLVLLLTTRGTKVVARLPH
jgi:hypothetical protein